MNDNENHNSDGQPGPPPSPQDTEGPTEVSVRQNGKGQLMHKAREVIYQTPDVRPEKVAELKEAIEQGRYEIDSEKLADILMDELFPKR